MPPPLVVAPSRPRLCMCTPLEPPPVHYVCQVGACFPRFHMGFPPPCIHMQNGECRVARERYVPPLYPLAPAHSNRTWVWGSPLSPTPVYARKRVQWSVPQPPSFPLTCASEAPPLPPLPPPRLLAERAQGWATTWEMWRGTTCPPATTLCLRGRQGHDREREGGGGCAAMWHVRSLGGALSPCVPHPASCTKGECSAAHKGTPSPSRPLPRSGRRGQ